MGYTASRGRSRRWPSTGARRERPITRLPALVPERLISTMSGAVETAGVLFMEGKGEPAEIARIRRELGAAERNQQLGVWPATAMDAAWGVAEALLHYPQLADLLGERHRIIANDWQAATMAATDRATRRMRARDPRPRPLRARRAARRPRGGTTGSRLPVLGLRAARPPGRPAKEAAPLGGLQERLGDRVPLFELLLSPRAARRAVPVLAASPPPASPC